MPNQINHRCSALPPYSMSHTYELILQAIGQAAVGCTDKEGVFDSTKAIEISKKLYQDILTERHKAQPDPICVMPNKQEKPSLMRYNSCNQTDTAPLIGDSKLEKIRYAAEKLWGIIDNVDTLSDTIKPSNDLGYKKFYDAVMNRVGKRFKYLSSDGFNLFTFDEIKNRNWPDRGTTPEQIQKDPPKAN